MFTKCISFFCLCPVNLVIKLNLIYILKVAYSISGTNERGPGFDHPIPNSFPASGSITFCYDKANHGKAKMCYI